MKILVETTDAFQHYLIVGLALLCAMVMISFVAFMIIMMVKERDFEFNVIVGIVLLFLFGIAFGIGGFAGIKDGATTTYKAVVTDFNEVYENGYEIVGQEGKLYLLQKNK